MVGYFILGSLVVSTITLTLYIIFKSKIANPIPPIEINFPESFTIDVKLHNITPHKDLSKSDLEFLKKEKEKKVNEDYLELSEAVQEQFNTFLKTEEKEK